MTTAKFQHGPIFPGFPWDMILHVAAPEPVFPEGSTYRADVKVNPSSATLATLDTASGGLVRVDDYRLAISFMNTQSQALAPGFVVLDLVRTDTPSPRHTGLRLRLPVEKSVTAPNA